MPTPLVDLTFKLTATQGSASMSNSVDDLITAVNALNDVCNKAVAALIASQKPPIPPVDQVKLDAALAQVRANTAALTPLVK